jgi:hypothetical protein
MIASGFGAIRNKFAASENGPHPRRHVKQSTRGWQPRLSFHAPALK